MTNPRRAVQDETEERAQQMANWLLELTAGRPAMLDAIERCLRALVLDERRQRIIDRLARLDEKDVATVSALVGQLEQQPREEA